MLRMTRQSDYGIVLISYLAARPERSFGAAELAAQTALPVPIVRKILKLLAKGALLVSHRGIKGGYSLARPASAISVADILTALEGPIALTECIEEAPGGCSHEALCPLRPKWQRINAVVHHALSSINLSQLIAPWPHEYLNLSRPTAALSTVQSPLR
ncbi:SUF system Fe-S cluster assembly regulator [Gloeobacter kilaueensis]|uniref:BadM/Rrf2 family transcriptional regulator n=1 Tax=Gloeobacter kilaueensis (strain ATCC BAA-2537 / CCAP 1431/1 / ULC 316 / JS1) TaxID=1183438 RepID=U5QKF5_GLOK1|nr:SUF system Fe-S cluster assembly regulator [Gloeobacter kilaueensis]AGY58175.1 BadM/Rrf2 family transcriptional regulator [Gloeobacter kilaueensis JS1]